MFFCIIYLTIFDLKMSHFKNTQLHPVYTAVVFTQQSSGGLVATESRRRKCVITEQQNENGKALSTFKPYSKKEYLCPTDALLCVDGVASRRPQFLDMT